MDNIHFVATSHIAKKSIQDIKKAFFDLDPDIVAVELDHGRLHALLSNQKPDYSLKGISKVGLKGYLFAVIGGLIQQRLGRMVGIQPGADMKQAALLAKNNHKLLLLLDQDISITLRKLSKAITWKERFRFLSDLLFGWLRKEKMTINLNKVPEEQLITTLLEKLKDRYPSMHRVLLAERNTIMAKKLAAAHTQHPDKKILVVIGAGHAKGMIKDFKHITRLIRKREAKKSDEDTHSEPGTAQQE